VSPQINVQYGPQSGDLPGICFERHDPAFETVPHVHEGGSLRVVDDGDCVLVNADGSYRVISPDSFAEEIGRLNALINSPEVLDFVKAVQLEAVHQRERWGADCDAGKTPADWFWLLGYLAGKALYAAIAGNTEKALHHVITTAAAACNWHAAILGKTDMRPGLSAEATKGVEA
jgi:hypothetical protein